MWRRRRCLPPSTASVRSPISISISNSTRRAGDSSEGRNPSPAALLLLTLRGSVPALLALARGRMAEAVMVYAVTRQLLQFLFAIIFFHSSEYALSVFYHGRSGNNLSFDSHSETGTDYSACSAALLISKQYVLAMTCALLEYAIEIRFCPSLKEYWWVSEIGFSMMIVGELVRKTAVITAGKSFTHMIRKFYEDQHRLITHGIYRYVRHPGYSGFFIWAVGTQVMLCNPICTVAFMIVLWLFFHGRIPYEEFFLKQFFGARYEEYARRVPSGLPFVR